MKNEFEIGEKVRFLSEWQDDDEREYVVVAPDEGKGRVTIQPVEWEHGRLIPQEVVQISMIERIKITL